MQLGVKPIHLPTLIEILLLGGKDDYVAVSTVELAKRLGRSQQAASRHLSDLEEAGYVERIRSGGLNRVKMTNKGADAMLDIYFALRNVLEGEERVFEIKGEVFTGLGEGAYYVSLRGYRRQFLKKIGFDPYPGTLNIRLNSPADRRLRRDLERYPNIRIEGFEDGYRTYGWAKCYPAKIDDAVDGMVILLERTHYDDSVLEVIAPVNIREKLSLRDGGTVSVKVYPSAENRAK